MPRPRGDGLRAVRLFISSDTNANWEKNGMAQRLSLPEMNELAVRLRHGGAMYKC